MFALISVHRVVVFAEQAFDPAPMQLNGAAALLFFQRCLHERQQTLVTLAAQAFVNVV